MLRPFADLNRNVGDISVFFRMVDSFSSVFLLVYMIYFLWRRQQLFIKFINAIFRNFHATTSPATRKYLWFVKLFVADSVIHPLFGYIGLAACLRKGEYCAKTVFTILTNLGFDVSTINSAPEACWPFHLVLPYYGIKYLMTVITLIVLPSYVIQHGFIICALFGLRLTWNDVKEKFSHPDLTFDRVKSS